MLAMLASIDGATLINRKGRLLAYGAIISSRPRGSEGARSAAALELSNKGFVIKVSADGPIALYEGGKEIVEA
jgi:DNA integrity scanning protein DisA with diadenylate cyclase activity